MAAAPTTSYYPMDAHEGEDDSQRRIRSSTKTPFFGPPIAVNVGDQPAPADKFLAVAAQLLGKGVTTQGIGAYGIPLTPPLPAYAARIRGFKGPRTRRAGDAHADRVELAALPRARPAHPWRERATNAARR